MAAVVAHVCRSLAVSERQLFQINLSFIGNGRLTLDGRLLPFNFRISVDYFVYCQIESKPLTITDLGYI